MSSRVQVKRSAVAGKVPTTADLDLGELAVNTYDGKLFLKKSVSGVESIIELGSSSTADTANRLATPRNINGVSFDGSADITIQDSTKLPLAGGTMTGAITFAAGQTWPTFNQNTTGSAATLTTGRTIGMTGDVTWSSASFNGSANVTGTATLANSGVTAGTYGSASAVPVITVDAKGRITSASTTTVTATDTTKLPLAGGRMTGNLTINNGSPTIYLQDTNHNSGMIHVNSNIFYVLRGDTNSTTWTQVNGYWPLVINLTNNNMQSGGSITAAGNVTAYSDERLKQDWQDLPQDFVEQLAQVKHGTYTRTDTNLRQVGVSAQSLQQVLPEAVQDGEYLSVAYGNAALAAVIELSKRVLELEDKIAKLQEK